MPQFEKLRISLDRAFTETPILDLTDYPDDHLPREEFLRRAFGEPRRFLKSGNPFDFHPIDAPDGYVAGFFSRARPLSARHADLTPYLAENYEPSLFVMSIAKDQTVWMEDRSEVGSPKPLIEAFFSHLLRKTPLKDWSAFVRYYERQEDFWQVVRDRRRDITKVILKFVPPNAYEGTKLAQEFYTAFQSEVDNDALEQTLKAKPGKMNLEGPMMHAAAEIAEQGAGERELRGPKNEILYSSERGRVTQKVDEGDMPTPQSPNFVGRIIFRLFG